MATDDPRMDALNPEEEVTHNLFSVLRDSAVSAAAHVADGVVTTLDAAGWRSDASPPTVGVAASVLVEFINLVQSVAAWLGVEASRVGPIQAPPPDDPPDTE